MIDGLFAWRVRDRAHWRCSRSPSRRSPTRRAPKCRKPFWTEGEAGDASARPDSFADLAEKVSPAVVNIKVERKQTLRGGPEELFEEFFGQQRKPGEKPARSRSRTRCACRRPARASWSRPTV